MSERESPIGDEPPTPTSPTPEGGDPPSVGDGATVLMRSRTLRTRIASARPRRRTVVLGVVVGVMAFALGGAAVAGSVFYEQYGAVRNAPNTAAWAGLTTRFAGAAVCTTCHAPEATAQDASIHLDVACESCHGPAAGHAASDVAARLVSLVKPSSAICATCHAAAEGRPAAFPQISVAAHFGGADCLRCHDPHSIVAVRPPTVTHPLVDLPPCTSCHAPDGLKKVPTGHELVADGVCLSCHRRAADGSSR
jgi:hypothetical protein